MLRKAFLPVLLCVLCFASIRAQVLREEFTPPAGLEQGWYARIETSMGRIIVQLLPGQAPQSVAHFVALAEGRMEWTDPATGEIRSGRYYDGTTVYRAVAGSFFQIGAETSAGGYTPFLYVPSPQDQTVGFRQGYLLGNVRVGPKVSAARLLLTAAAQPELVDTVPCFGRVVEGREVVYLITAVKARPNGRPIDPVLIERVRIFSVGSPAPLPDPVPYLPEVEPPVKIELNEPRRRQ